VAQFTPMTLILEYGINIIYGSNLMTVKDLDCKYLCPFAIFFIFAISLSVLRSIMASGYYPLFPGT
jgi:hypothetical protein